MRRNQKPIYFYLKNFIIMSGLSSFHLLIFWIFFLSHFIFKFYFIIQIIKYFIDKLRAQLFRLLIAMV